MSQTPALAMPGPAATTPKPPHVAEMIKTSIKNTSVSQYIREQQLEQLVLQMKQVHVQKGEVVIAEGDSQATHLYIAETGEYEVTVKGKRIEQYKTGGKQPAPCFGERALMYRQTRAATITCVVDGVLWSLERRGFEAALMPTQASHLFSTALMGADDGARCHALAKMRELPPEELADYTFAIVMRLDDLVPCVRRMALRAMGALAPALLAKHVDRVVERLADHVDVVRSAALSVMGRLEPAALQQHAVAVLAKLEDKEAFVRRAAVQALGALCAALPSHSAAVAARLKDEASQVRSEALGTLYRLEPAALKAHAGALAARLDDEDPNIAFAAALTLRRVEAPALKAHVATLVGKLDHPDEGMRWAVLATLAQLDVPTLGAHAATIERLVDDADLSVRTAVGDLLGRLRPKKAPAAPPPPPVPVQEEEANGTGRRRRVSRASVLHAGAISEPAAKAGADDVEGRDSPTTTMVDPEELGVC